MLCGLAASLASLPWVGFGKLVTGGGACPAGSRPLGSVSSVSMGMGMVGCRRASGHQLGDSISSAPRSQAMPTPSTRLNTRAMPSSSRASHSPPERARRTPSGLTTPGGRVRRAGLVAIVAAVEGRLVAAATTMAAWRSSPS